MVDSLQETWTRAFQQWARDRLGAILDTREREYREVLRWLELGVYAEFVPLTSVIDDDVDPAGDGVGVMVRQPDDPPDQSAPLTFIPVATASNASPQYVVNAVGPCRGCRRPTRLEPTLHLVAEGARDLGTRHVPVLLGQALTNGRPVALHDCRRPPRSSGDESGTGLYL